MIRQQVIVVGAFAAMVLGAVGLAPGVQAGAKKSKVEFSYRMAPELPVIKDSRVYLRPNTDHAVEFFVKNVETDPEEDALKEVVVKLMRVDTVPPIMIAAAKLDGDDKLLPGKEARLFFLPAKAPPDKAPPDKAPPDKALPDKGMPAPKLQLWLEAKNKVTATQDLKVLFEHPSRYVDVEEGRFDRATRKLSFIVSLKKSFFGPPCTVSLVLDPEYLPGLKEVKNRTLTQTLNKIGQGLEVFAELEFDASARDLTDAPVFLAVDGFDRAFEFQPNFNETGLIRPVVHDKDIAVRLRTKRYPPPDDKKNPLTVSLEVDARTIDQPALVELSFNRSEDNKEDSRFETELLGQGLRDVKVIVGVGPKGELLCKTTVTDWKATIATTELLGKRWLRVRVLDEKGKIEKPPSRDALKPLEFGRSGLAALTLEGNNVFADVVLDASGAEGIKFVGLPLEWKPGKDLEVKVITKPRPKSRYAQIEKAVFFLGKADDKIPMDEQVPGLYQDGVWSAVLHTPDKAGKQPVTVQFFTANGKVSTGTDVVMLKAPDPASIRATVKGKVTNAAERPVTGAKVQLVGAKGAIKGEQKTDEKGMYAFKNVAPGEYTVNASVFVSSLHVGAAPVEVPPATELVEKIDIVVRPK